MFLKTITAMAIDSSKEEVKDEQQHSVTTHPKPTPTENQVTTLNVNIQTPNNTSEDQEGPPNTPPLTPLEEVWQEEPLDLPWLEKHPEKLQHSQPSSPAAHQIGPTLLLRCPTLHPDQIRGLQADPALA